MSAQFTPGPWQWVNDDDIEQAKEPYTHVAETVRVFKDEDRAQQNANCRLIAAAPELYEALEHDIRFFDSVANDEHWEATGIGNLCRGYAARRRDLLAKARGEP